MKMKLAIIGKTSPIKIIRMIQRPLKLALGSLSSSPSKKALLMARESYDDTRIINNNNNNNKVPKGFLAVYVGPEHRRFVIPICFLAMPDFRILMERVADEYGCDHDGAIQIPCEEDHFQQILISCYRRKRIITPKEAS